MRQTKLLLLIWFLCCAPSVCRAQVGELQAKAIAEAATRAALNFPDSKLLRAERREDLEDDLFAFQVKVIGKIAKAAYFYEISEQGYFVLAPDRAIYAQSTGFRLNRLVAVSTKTGQAYTLFGFANAESEFNRLVKDASIKLSHDSDARLYTSLYIKAVVDLRQSRLVHDWRQLKHKGEDYFFTKYPESQAASLFNQWWDGFSPAKQHIAFGVRAQKQLDGYLAQFTYISNTNKEGAKLEAKTINISPDGLCRVGETYTIYPKIIARSK
jgi:hypothetical protein